MQQVTNPPITLLLALTVVGTGCDYSNDARRDDSAVNQTGSADANSTDGSSSGQNTTSSTNGSQTTDGQGSGGQPVGTGTSDSTVPGGEAELPADCVSAPGCGGAVVGSWTVASSCLELSGEMDVFLTSLACATVPVTGYLQTSGKLTFYEDGSYADETTTTGKVTFPLDASCLAISGVDVECDRVGAIFSAIGWNTAACTGAGGECNCELQTEQQAGLGVVLPYTEPTGAYSTSGDELTVSNATYSYCASGDNLTLTPQMDSLVGSVELLREGAASADGAGGMSGDGAGGMTSMDGSGGADTMGMGGMNGDGTGGMSGDGAGGMSSEGSGGMGGEGSGGEANAGMGGMGGNDGAVTTEAPCDIYEAAGNPCVAAHSTVRALYAAYDGALYQVRRADGMMQDIGVLSPGGFADSAQQDSFCSGSMCTIWRLYDQTGNGNFLEAQTPDSSVGGNNGMAPANASAEQLTVGGHQVYSLFTRPSQAYWNDGSQTGMPLGSEPQGIYMVTSGEHYNGGCCYNYGNAQLDRNYHGGPTMDAVYFGNNTIWGTGAGEGPWVMADMEDGMLSGGTPGAQNPNSMSLPFPYVTAMEKNNGTDTFALKGGDATQPTLNTMWSGPLPNSKRPMAKEGAVILGAGGDCCYSNNNASEGTFYEGAIVSGYPSDETDEAIHANIVETGYGQ